MAPFKPEGQTFPAAGMGGYFGADWVATLLRNGGLKGRRINPSSW